MVRSPITQPNEASVEAFLASVADPKRRHDAQTVTALITDVTGATPSLWGTSIVGWGTRDVAYANGRTQPWLRIGLSPRKGELSLYGLRESAGDLSALGKVTSGKGCIGVKKLTDIDLEALKTIVHAAWASP